MYDDNAKCCVPVEQVEKVSDITRDIIGLSAVINEGLNFVADNIGARQEAKPLQGNDANPVSLTDALCITRYKLRAACEKLDTIKNKL